ncbi:MAG: hypothetical protein JJV90_01275 [Spiroplasma sp.]|nr:hypothetical protein [Mycoplasmatales bacterium]
MNVDYQLLNCTTDLQVFKDNAITVSPTTIIYDNDIEVGRFYGLKKESYIKEILT